MLPNGFRNAKIWSFESPSCEKNNLVDITDYKKGKLNQVDKMRIQTNFWWIYGPIKGSKKHEFAKSTKMQPAKIEDPMCKFDIVHNDIDQVLLKILAVLA